MDPTIWHPRRQQPGGSVGPNLSVLRNANAFANVNVPTEDAAYFPSLLHRIDRFGPFVREVSVRTRSFVVCAGFLVGSQALVSLPVSPSPRSCESLRQMGTCLRKSDANLG